MQTFFPLVASGASLLYVLVRLGFLRYLSLKADGYALVEEVDGPLANGSKYAGRSDLQIRNDNNGGCDEDHLPIRCTSISQSNRSILELNHPKGEVIVSVLEVIALAGEIGVHLAVVSISAGARHRTLPEVAELIAWGYILALAAARHVIARVEIRQCPNLWNQTAMLYGVQWMCAILIFRSTVLHPRIGPFQHLAIADFALASVLLLITLTSRKGNRPVTLEHVDDLQPSREPLASLLSIATFSWVDAIVWHGYKKTFEIEAVWNLAPRDKAAMVLADFRQVKKTTKLAMHFLRYFKRDLLIQGAWAIGNGFLTFVPTLLLKAILEYVENPQDTPVNAAWFYVVLLACSAIAEGVTNGQGLWRGRKICIRLHAIIVGEVYAKALRRKAAAASDTILGEGKKTGDKTSDHKTSMKAKLRSLGRKKKAKNQEPNESSPAKNDSDSQVNTGTIINLMAVDSFKLSDVCSYLHFLWAASPVQLVVCVLLLYRILGLTSFVSILIMILAMPLNYYIAQQFSRTQKKVMAATDARIHTTNEVLQNIRIIKYFAWEQRFSAIVDEKRALELRAIRNKYILWTCAAAFWFATPLVIAFFSFMLYTLVEKKPLIPSVAFTALSLFGILRIPLDQLADMIAHVQEAKVSVDRIEEFLNEDETEKYEQLSLCEKDKDGQTLIAFEKATFTWGSRSGSTQDSSSAFRLIGMDTRFHVGGLNIIAGQTGSGKTSLLMALLGEMTLVEGRVSMAGGHSREDLEVDPETGLIESVAYCAQQAWLVNDDIKQNILFSAPYDANRYQRVVAACALERDLEILHEGDATLVGEKGIALSGGQKQRISLARALYCNSRHVLLDDCLSAVDSHTAKHIFEQCILGPLMFGRTCILVTHNVTLCVPFSQHVVVLANGKIAVQGPPDEVMSSGLLGEEGPKSKPNSKHGTRNHSRAQSVNGFSDGVDHSASGKSGKPDGVAPEPSKGKSSTTNGPEGKANTRTEGKTTGRVKLTVLKMYLAAMGPWYFWALAFALFVGQQISSIATTVWIRQWANSYPIDSATQTRLERHEPAAHYSGGTGRFIQTHCVTSGTCAWRLMQFPDFSQNYTMTSAGAAAEVNVAYYLGVYALLGLLYIAVSMVREGLLFYGSLSASKKIHTQLLVSVTRAQFKFFDSTPLGQLMNRFSKDLEAIDQEVAPIAVGVLGCLATVICIVVLISVITPRFLIAALFISITYFAIGKFYLSSSTDLKRLESVQRSPLYQQFGETLSGVTTIRAYGDEQRFIRDNQHRVDTHHRPFIYLWAANRWLALRVDVTGAMVSFFAGVFIILSIGKIDAGAAGLSLTYAVTFTENVLWLVRLYASNEQNMNSVERVNEYLHIKQEAQAIVPESRPDGNWPSQGNIDFIEFSTRYRADLQPVLKRVTFSVRAAERIGVVGRTGAGKSSLALALFRGLEADEGKIVIDGVDIAEIGLQDLRQAITIVPQDPTLFTGTIRTNLDPFNLFTDEEIFTTLRQVQLIGPATSAGCSPEGTPEAANTPMGTATPASSQTLQARDNNELSLSRELTNTRDNVNPFTNLSSAVAESGSNLSQGQRQLLCLARALLKAPRVLLMDEATASIDYATDSKIQDTLRAVKDSTIITIAHRLQTIIDYDKVLVLDKGEVIEFDTPWGLLSKEKSIFRGMCETSGDLESLLEGAKAAEDKKNLIDV